ncbi:MAG: hypothetical protein AB9922_03885 [Bacteroidales bacterium]
MVYRFKASIPGNKIFMREYEVKGSSSLYALHLYLQNDLGFAPDQIVLFRAIDIKGKVRKEYGLFNLGDGSMDSVTVDKFHGDGFKVLEYVYDMFKDRSLQMEIIATEEELARRAYPRLVAERGKNPDQFSDNYDDFEHMIEPAEGDQILSEGELQGEVE